MGFLNDFLAALRRPAACTPVRTRPTNIFGNAEILLPHCDDSELCCSFGAGDETTQPDQRTSDVSRARGPNPEADQDRYSRAGSHPGRDLWPNVRGTYQQCEVAGRYRGGASPGRVQGRAGPTPHHAMDVQGAYARARV